MRTTIRRDETLLDHAKVEALTALIEQGLRMAMARTPVSTKLHIEIPDCALPSGAFAAKRSLVPDAWFAAIAIKLGCWWFTLNGDFARFRGLRLCRP